MLSLFTHSQIAPNLHEILSSVEYENVGNQTVDGGQ